MKSNDLQKEYNLPVYRNWKDVPGNYCTRTFAKRELKLNIPKGAKPDAIKNAGSTTNRDGIFFLYDIKKYSVQVQSVDCSLTEPLMNAHKKLANITEAALKGVMIPKQYL